MFTRRLACALLVMLSVAGSAWTQEPHVSRYAKPGPDGKLVYAPGPENNRLPNFSHCGYMGGGVRIPVLPVRVTLEPAEGDDTARIQAAIDRVSDLAPDPNGFRGAVLLTRGRYEVSGSLTIAASGVVLRGQGQGEDDTVIVATGEDRRTLVKIGGRGGYQVDSKTKQQIVDERVPSGHRTITVADASGFKPGDTVIVYRGSTAEWIEAIGMDKIPSWKLAKDETYRWKPGSIEHRFDRVVTAVQGNRITLDVALVQAIEKKYGGGWIARYRFPGRIEHSGIERLRLVSANKGGQDEAHSANAVLTGALQNGWIRQVTAVHFTTHAVHLFRTSKWITVEDCESLDPVSKVAGGRRYGFGLKSHLSLVQRCRSTKGRHDFNMHDKVAGPNVFLDCVAEDSYDASGCHHRWAVGTLYDNCTIKGPRCALNVANRGGIAGGHGWTGAQMVFWNCTAPIFCVQTPPTGWNLAVGCTPIPDRPRAQQYWPMFIGNANPHKKLHYEYGRLGNGEFESWGQPVTPRSLYLKQLEDRLGKDAVENIRKTQFD